MGHWTPTGIEPTDYDDDDDDDVVIRHTFHCRITPKIRRSPSI